eukprot:scaffold9373_cov107-Isochrysis_galbana.AAC.7
MRGSRSLGTLSRVAHAGFPVVRGLGRRAIAPCERERQDLWHRVHQIALGAHNGAAQRHLARREVARRDMSGQPRGVACQTCRDVDQVGRARVVNRLGRHATAAHGHVHQLHTEVLWWQSVVREREIKWERGKQQRGQGLRWDKETCRGQER